MVHLTLIPMFIAVMIYSVLNAFNQVHTVPNVFVTDGACMTSASSVNPSITYMALTARAADHAIKELNKQNL